MRIICSGVNISEPSPMNKMKITMMRAFVITRAGGGFNEISFRNMNKIND